MFERIFVEKDIINWAEATNIIKKVSKDNSHEIIEIDDVDNYFNRKKKPYLQKRSNLNLFLAKKKGTLLRPAPDAYGQEGASHYYFINAYNCIYECQYCYLQGYFNSPDIVLFLNYKDMCQAMESKLSEHGNNNKVWFHAGEFSDSLALSHLTGELKHYHDFLIKNPNAIMELRTKSVNIKSILDLPALPNLITSFSLSPLNICKEIEVKTPPLSSRLKAMGELIQSGHPVAVHFDPIFVTETYLEDYKSLIELMLKEFKNEIPCYISLGVVRFTKEVYRQVQLNYPDSKIQSEEMIKSFDGKVRYPRPIRYQAMNKIKDILINSGVPKESIYLCMEG